MSKYSIAFINVYFGTFPNYFEFWLESCRINKGYDWIIFTDNKGKYEYPPNVHVFHTTINEVRNRIQSLFEFEISLETPYKLCDYRPAYGEIFREELKGFDFWGHCDMDLIWGKISHFITAEILENYDKIFEWGHCTLYRNDDYICSGYRKFGKENGIGYKEVFTNPKNMVFDENGGSLKWGGINSLFKNHKVSIYSETPFDDLKIAHYNLCSYRKIKQNVQLIESRKIQYVPAIYRFSDGILEQMLVINDELVITESMYVHMQKRPMQIAVQKGAKEFLIVPNCFIINQIIDKHFVKRYGRHRLFYWNYIKFRFKNLKKKLSCYLPV